MILDEGGREDSQHQEGEALHTTNVLACHEDGQHSKEDRWKSSKLPVLWIMYELLSQPSDPLVAVMITHVKRKMGRDSMAAALAMKRAANSR